MLSPECSQEPLPEYDRQARIVAQRAGYPNRGTENEGSNDTSILPAIPPAVEYNLVQLPKFEDDSVKFAATPKDHYALWAAARPTSADRDIRLSLPFGTEVMATSDDWQKAGEGLKVMLLDRIDTVFLCRNSDEIAVLANRLAPFVVDYGNQEYGPMEKDYHDQPAQSKPESKGSLLHGYASFIEGIDRPDRLAQMVAEHQMRYLDGVRALLPQLRNLRPALDSAAARMIGEYADCRDAPDRLNYTVRLGDPLYMSSPAMAIRRPNCPDEIQLSAFSDPELFKRDLAHEIAHFASGSYVSNDDPYSPFKEGLYLPKHKLGRVADEAVTEMTGFQLIHLLDSDQPLSHKELLGRLSAAGHYVPERLSQILDGAYRLGVDPDRINQLYFRADRDTYSELINAYYNPDDPLFDLLHMQHIR